MKIPRLILSAGVASCLLSTAFTAPLAAETKIYTNQMYVEEARLTPAFAIEDNLAVFEMVLGSLPDVVTVYPTENYYYFYFHYKGIKYSGNLRFDIADRDKGLVHFNYFKDFTQWQRDESGFSRNLSAKDGVTIKSLGKLAYSVAYKNKTVRFELNDLSGVKPPASAVQKGEVYIGPVFDESGIRFFLVFNQSRKTFHYILDESAPLGDQFNTVAGADRITIGIRTGFAFYADQYADRKILVGVNQFNTSVNNYLDGPFDQLPDNFIEGNVLRDAILAASPEMEGQMDRFGNSPDGETRYLIAPYLQYEDENELAMISDCAKTEKPPVYFSCFSFAGSTDNGSEENQEEATPPK